MLLIIKRLKKKSRRKDHPNLMDKKQHAVRVSCGEFILSSNHASSISSSFGNSFALVQEFVKFPD